MMKLIQVAVGVIKNRAGEILIARRGDALHQGGLWEFPGGKIEPGETVEQALARELEEELGIVVRNARPLVRVNHRYPDLAVQLQVLTVEDFAGEPTGREGQPILWVRPDALSCFDFPAANFSIITAARLPPFYAILDDSAPTMLMVNLEGLLQQGIKLIQARLKRLTTPRLTRFLEQAYPLCRQYQAYLLLNSASVDISAGLHDGIHLTSRDLMTCNNRPEGMVWLAASCHNLAELKHAEAIGVDFAVLAPVMATTTHPGAETLGWQGFAELVDQVNLPVYALGGMIKADLAKVNKLGGQGIAAIRAFSQ